MIENPYLIAFLEECLDVVLARNQLSEHQRRNGLASKERTELVERYKKSFRRLRRKKLYKRGRKVANYSTNANMSIETFMKGVCDF